ncbi:hypothetical protein Tsp_08136 [Trichinella spiralis]|uniref:hypothetical protein n=1 Tax=Trichinella spiralis TaxID=6334 RepID=UPI0001EFE4B6|nr:hypothetical protein Tsp_08136 [Trichinella spiralis]
MLASNTFAMNEMRNQNAISESKLFRTNELFKPCGRNIKLVNCNVGERSGWVCHFEEGRHEESRASTSIQLAHLTKKSSKHGSEDYGYDREGADDGRERWPEETLPLMNHLKFAYFSFHYNSSLHFITVYVCYIYLFFNKKCLQ